MLFNLYAFIYQDTYQKEVQPSYEQVTSHAEELAPPKNETESIDPEKADAQGGTDSTTTRRRALIEEEGSPSDGHSQDNSTNKDSDGPSTYLPPD